jgi:hypothetical protein
MILPCTCALLLRWETMMNFFMDGHLSSWTQTAPGLLFSS